MAVKWVDRVPTRANRVLVTPEDGSTPYYATITRADEPSVVGTPVNAANLNAMQEGNGLTANRTVFVSTTGSNTTGDGTPTAPYATINKALSTIPKNLNGYEAAIYISAGTYPEIVNIRGFSNGILRLTGESGSVVTVSGFEIQLTQFAEITNINFILVDSYLNAIGANLRVFTPFAASGARYGVHAAFFSNLLFADTVTVNNSENYSVVSTNNSNVYINNLEGMGNNVSFRCLIGSVITFGADSSSRSNVQSMTESGGRVLSGSQTEPPNY